MNEGSTTRAASSTTSSRRARSSAARSSRGSGTCPRNTSTCSKRTGVPKRLRPLVGGKVNVDLIDRILGAHPAGGVHHGGRNHAAEPAPAQARRVSAPERAGGGDAGSRRLHPTLPVHDRVDHGPRRAPTRPGRLEQGAPCRRPGSAAPRFGPARDHHVEGLDLARVARAPGHAPRPRRRREARPSPQKPPFSCPSAKDAVT